MTAPRGQPPCRRGAEEGAAPGSSAVKRSSTRATVPSLRRRPIAAGPEVARVALLNVQLYKSSDRRTRIDGG